MKFNFFVDFSEICLVKCKHFPTFIHDDWRKKEAKSPDQIKMTKNWIKYDQKFSQWQTLSFEKKFMTSTNIITAVSCSPVPYGFRWTGLGSGTTGKLGLHKVCQLQFQSSSIIKFRRCHGSVKFFGHLDSVKWITLVKKKQKTIPRK